MDKYEWILRDLTQTNIYWNLLYVQGILPGAVLYQDESNITPD